MIDKSSALKTIRHKAADLEIGHAIDLRTYKRNRSVVIIRRGPDTFQLEERGYEANTFEVSSKGLVKILKILLKREFPRSNKIRLYQLGRYEEGKNDRMQRKTL
ncbi:MAG: hypothetical protein ACOC0U_07375 [Desulfovibrionales bacterium]